MPDPDIRIECLSGQAIQARLADVAALRIEVFRAWPYLYDGSLEYEQQYLRIYVDCKDSILVLAFDGERVVGASTGLPLDAEDQAFRAPFVTQGRDTAKIFYCAESVLLPAYRGLGIGHRFFDERERHARALGLTQSVFCRVERPADHPLRPENYVPLDAFWSKRGYTQESTLQARFEWRDIGNGESDFKPLTFWQKPL